MHLKRRKCIIFLPKANKDLYGNISVTSDAEKIAPISKLAGINLNYSRGSTGLKISIYLYNYCSGFGAKMASRTPKDYYFFYIFLPMDNLSPKNVMRKIQVSLTALLAGITLVICSSFISKTQTDNGWVNLDISYVTVIGDNASIKNLNTGVTYNIVAVDTNGSIGVPCGEYEVIHVANNSYYSPLISQTTPTGTTFTIDANTPSFGLYANCY